MSHRTEGNSNAAHHDSWWPPMPLYDPTDSNVGAVTITALSLCLCSRHYIEDKNGPENVVFTGCPPKDFDD